MVLQAYTDKTNVRSASLADNQSALTRVVEYMHCSCLSRRNKKRPLCRYERAAKFHRVINLSQNIAQLSITAKTVRKLLTYVPTYFLSKKKYISAILPSPASTCLLHSTGLMILATSTSLIEASRIQLFIQKIVYDRVATLSMRNYIFAEKS